MFVYMVRPTIYLSIYIYICLYTHIVGANYVKTKYVGKGMHQQGQQPSKPSHIISHDRIDYSIMTTSR